MIVTFRVNGRPMPKGSKTAVAYRDPRARRGVRARVIEGGNLSKTTRALREQWATSIAAAAEAAMNGRTPLSGPIEVIALFFLVRPKTGPGRKRAYPTVKPDVDKFLRAALDPLTGVVLRDDAQIVNASARKLYTDSSAPYGVFTVVELE